jgi:Uma2 family endonuclease
MAATTSQLTVEEFRKLPEDSGAVHHELRHGEIGSVTRPKLKHHLIQARTRDLLKVMAPAGAFVEYEVVFRALPEHESRVADTAYTWEDRLKHTDPDDNFVGAPDIIELFSL